jgi:hypothetical protein
MYSFIYLFIYLFIYFFIHVFIHSSIHPFIHLSMYPCIHSFIHHSPATHKTGVGAGEAEQVTITSIQHKEVSDVYDGKGNKALRTVSVLTVSPPLQYSHIGQSYTPPSNEDVSFNSEGGDDNGDVLALDMRAEVLLLNRSITVEGVVDSHTLYGANTYGARVMTYFKPLSNSSLQLSNVELCNAGTCVYIYIYIYICEFECVCV